MHNQHTRRHQQPARRARHVSAAVGQAQPKPGTAGSSCSGGPPGSSTITTRWARQFCYKRMQGLLVPGTTVTCPHCHCSSTDSAAAQECLQYKQGEGRAEHKTSRARQPRSPQNMPSQTPSASRQLLLKDAYWYNMLCGRVVPLCSKTYHRA